MKALIRACHDHLEREEQVLSRAEQTMMSLRRALGAGDESSLERCLQASDDVAVCMQQMKQRRKALRGRMSETLGVADRDVTVADVIQRAEPQSAATLRLKRESVQRLSRQVEALTLTTAALVKQNLHVYQHILSRLTGADAQTASYSKTGKSQTPSCQGATRARC